MERFWIPDTGYQIPDSAGVGGCKFKYQVPFPNSHYLVSGVQHQKRSEAVGFASVRIASNR